MLKWYRTKALYVNDIRMISNLLFTNKSIKLRPMKLNENYETRRKPQSRWNDSVTLLSNHLLQQHHDRCQWTTNKFLRCRLSRIVWLRKGRTWVGWNVECQAASIWSVCIWGQNESRWYCWQLKSGHSNTHRNGTRNNNNKIPSPHFLLNARL